MFVLNLCSPAHVCGLFMRRLCAVYVLPTCKPSSGCMVQRLSVRLRVRARARARAGGCEAKGRRDCGWQHARPKP